ncbi:MAG: HAD family hydrolase [Candidatus Aminicenantes bacterium]|jgi:phosphoglycolate phosphatase
MKKKPHIELLIVDLDNTLYDWIGFFVPAFYRMINAAVEILNVDRETLLTDIQVVHQKYGNSEHPFALLETKAVKNRFPGKNRAELAKLLGPAFHAFNKKRKELLRLFPGVLETLQFIHESGCKIVAYTEADVRNSLFRIEALGIRQYILRLYAPISPGLTHPHGKDSYVKELRNGFLWLLPKEYRKPNPKILEDIFVEFSLYPDKALYVGDSIIKDISMAKRAGTHAAWARYGTKYDKKLWEKLVRITHWTKEDVAREFQLRNKTRDVSPDVELDRFDQVTGYYVFCPASYEVNYQGRDNRVQSFLRSTFAGVSD